MPIIVGTGGASGGDITNYAGLQNAIATWLHRDDLNVNITDFIDLCESVMSSRLKSRSMETRTNLSCVASNAFVTLPTDLLEMRRLYLTSTTPQRILKYVTPDELSYSYPYTTTDEPVAFTVVGGSLQLAPIPDSAYTMELTYLQRIPALTNDNTTNWVLTSFPNAYLYGSLLQAMTLVQDEARMAVYQKLFDDAVNAINSIDWYSGTTMTVRTA